MLTIWLAVCALTMLAALAALADAARSGATANSAGFGWSPPSLARVMVTS
jgi:ABC-type proline/glycine betaine transport system substrate-binding protein